MDEGTCALVREMPEIWLEDGLVMFRVGGNVRAYTPHIATRIHRELGEVLREFYAEQNVTWIKEG